MAPIPPHGPFDERPTVDFIDASAVFLLSVALSGMTFIGLAAIFGWALS